MQDRDRFNLSDYEITLLILNDPENHQSEQQKYDCEAERSDQDPIGRKIEASGLTDSRLAKRNFRLRLDGELVPTVRS